MFHNFKETRNKALRHLQDDVSGTNTENEEKNRNRNLDEYLKMKNCQFIKYYDQKKQQSMNTTFQNIRSKVVFSIFSIQQKIATVSRNSMFLAISILDLYLKHMIGSHDNLHAQVVDQKIHAIACFILAWKFQGDRNPKMGEISQVLGMDLCKEKLLNQVIKTEEKILIGINFTIPHMTAYEFLDSSVIQDELHNEQKRREVARSIKIMLTAVLLTSEISFDPSIGESIHRMTKKIGRVDLKVRNIYKRCLKFLQNQKKTIQ